MHKYYILINQKLNIEENYTKGKNLIITCFICRIMRWLLIIRCTIVSWYIAGIWIVSSRQCRSFTTR